MTVGGQPRQVVTAEFVDRRAGQSADRSGSGVAPVSTNEGGGAGRLFAFIVDQNTLDVGSARRVASATAPFFSRLTFSDRSGLLLMPLGPNVQFTWSHDRVREALNRVTGIGRSMMGWENGSLAEARDIANRNTMALRGMGDRECGALASGSGSHVAAPLRGDRVGGIGAVRGRWEQWRGGRERGLHAGPDRWRVAGGGDQGSQRTAGPSNGFGMNTCSRDIQMQARVRLALGSDELACQHLDAAPGSRRARARPR